MKRYLFLMYTVLGSFFLSSDALAQTIATNKADSLAITKNILLNVGSQYVSNLTYAGRRDISSVPILLPNITLVSTKGFFLGTAAYVNATQNNFSADGLSITPGYVFPLSSNKKLGGVLSATKYFFKDSSAVILNSFNATTDAAIYYQAKLMKISLSGSYQIGKIQNDFVNTLELLKEIPLIKGLKISPTLSLMAGTQSFYQTYYTQTTRQRKIINPSENNAPIVPILPGGGNQQPSESVINETVTEEQQREIRKYNLLASTLSVPFNYKINQLQLNFTPYFIKPINQVQLSSEEQAGNLFFLFNTGISFTF